MATTTKQVSWWGPGDWNGFFGLGTNVLTNLLVLTGLLKFVVKIPDATLFGQILPAVGAMLFLGNMYYAWMAKRLADKEGRDDVTALPSGPSVPHMFFVVFAIMLPISISTKDPMQAWHAGLAWVFIEGLMLFVGAFIAPHIRRVTPRAALLGTLAGISITFISMRPAFEIMQTPVIGLISLAIILGAWYGGVRYPGKVPGGLVAIAVGTALAWLGYVFGLGSIINITMNPSAVGTAVGNVNLNIPLPVIGDVINGLATHWKVIIITAIPFGVYDFIEAMDNVESASAAGDEYSVKETLMAEGSISLLGTLLGSPFANAVYIGHPGWKDIGGRIGYSVATGFMVLVLTWLSIIGLMLEVIPLVAIIPILLYIGLLIGAQAFQETPAHHAPAIVLALVPNLAAWAKVQIDGALGAAGTNAAAVGFDKLSQTGVLYQGLDVLAGGAVVTGLLWGAMAVFVMDREHKMAASFAGVAAVLTFFGFIHGSAVGIASTSQTWMLTVSYLIVAGIFYSFSNMDADPAPKRAK